MHLLYRRQSFFLFPPGFVIAVAYFIARCLLPPFTGDLIRDRDNYFEAGEEGNVKENMVLI